MEGKEDETNTMETGLRKRGAGKVDHPQLEEQVLTLQEDFNRTIGSFEDKLLVSSNSNRQALLTLRKQQVRMEDMLSKNAELQHQLQEAYARIEDLEIQIASNEVKSRKASKEYARQNQMAQQLRERSSSELQTAQARIDHLEQLLRQAREVIASLKTKHESLVVSTRHNEQLVRTGNIQEQARNVLSLREIQENEKARHVRHLQALDEVKSNVLSVARTLEQRRQEYEQQEQRKAQAKMDKLLGEYKRASLQVVRARFEKIELGRTALLFGLRLWDARCVHRRQLHIDVAWVIKRAYDKAWTRKKRLSFLRWHRVAASTTAQRTRNEFSTILRTREAENRTFRCNVQALRRLENLARMQLQKQLALSRLEMFRYKCDRFLHGGETVRRALERSSVRQGFAQLKTAWFERKERLRTMLRSWHHESTRNAILERVLSKSHGRYVRRLGKAWGHWRSRHCLNVEHGQRKRAVALWIRVKLASARGLKKYIEKWQMFASHHRAKTYVLGRLLRNRRKKGLTRAWLRLRDWSHFRNHLDLEDCVESTKCSLEEHKWHAAKKQKSMQCRSLVHLMVLCWKNVERKQLQRCFAFWNRKMVIRIRLERLEACSRKKQVSHCLSKWKSCNNQRRLVRTHLSHILRSFAKRQRTIRSKSAFARWSAKCQRLRELELHALKLLRIFSLGMKRQAVQTWVRGASERKLDMALLQKHNAMASYQDALSRLTRLCSTKILETCFRSHVRIRCLRAFRTWKSKWLQSRTALLAYCLNRYILSSFGNLRLSFKLWRVTFLDRPRKLRKLAITLLRVNARRYLRAWQYRCNRKWSKQVVSQVRETDLELQRLTRELRIARSRQDVLSEKAQRTTEFSRGFVRRFALRKTVQMCHRMAIASAFGRWLKAANERKMRTIVSLTRLSLCLNARQVQWLSLNGAWGRLKKHTFLAGKGIGVYRIALNETRLRIKQMLLRFGFESWKATARQRTLETYKQLTKAERIFARFSASRQKVLWYLREWEMQAKWGALVRKVRQMDVTCREVQEQFGIVSAYNGALLGCAQRLGLSVLFEKMARNQSGCKTVALGRWKFVVKMAILHEQEMADFEQFHVMLNETRSELTKSKKHHRELLEMELDLEWRSTAIIEDILKRLRSGKAKLLNIGQRSLDEKSGKIEESDQDDEIASRLSRDFDDLDDDESGIPISQAIALARELVAVKRENKALREELLSESSPSKPSK